MSGGCAAFLDHRPWAPHAKLKRDLQDGAQTVSPLNWVKEAGEARLWADWGSGTDSVYYPERRLPGTPVSPSYSEGLASQAGVLAGTRTISFMSYKCNIWEMKVVINARLLS